MLPVVGVCTRLMVTVSLRDKITRQPVADRAREYDTNPDVAASNSAVRQQAAAGKVHSSRLDVVEDVRKAGRAAEGDHNRVAAPADEHLHVLPGFPENLDVLQAEHLQGTAQPDVDLCFAALRGAGDGVSSQTCLAAHMLHQAS